MSVYSGGSAGSGVADGARIALVTGGAGGLGLATARRFAHDGLRVVVADLDEALARSVAGDLDGGGHHGLALDIASEAAVIAAFETIEREIGPIAVLAHFAGTAGSGVTEVGTLLAGSTVAEWHRIMSVNALGTFLCVREMARCRSERPVDHARIITVSSVAGIQGGGQSGVAYAASKAAVLGLTRTAARDLGPLGITVNAIAPGPIETPMLARTQKRPGGTYPWIDAVPLRRVGMPEEIAEAASFLASEGAAFVTGATIDVNGGLLMN
ncbi:SDR family NAD(P)-dependent oxidoreductase [Sphingomonas sp.]|uniref:SDR family oxidoreductase n=1 Tax=Sphingomonas sp. TaxID=28214 RepID=UPI000DB34802|nr:SDR family NAD(P)-dependent oxidoreductase [Sphingomonas sp.]PZU09085.1 MAG: short-chain dehydrogenase [Sphingomonas sp.]